MPKNIITGNAAAQEYLRQQKERYHAYSLFAWRQRMTKKEAAALAWQEMRQRLGK